MSVEGALTLIEEHDVKFVDLRFTDTKGKEQHVSVPASQVDEDFFEDGKMFDGSSIAGWRGIQESDMVLMPDPESGVLDPFLDETTLILRCDVLEPSTMAGYGRDPRSLARRAEAYLQSTGIADAAYFGPEPEFFVFDSVHWSDDPSGSSCKVDSEEAAWNSGRAYEDGNTGHRPKIKGGYFPVPPVDSLQDLRSAMSLAMEEMGLVVEVHHHEVATAGQCEIGTRFASLMRKADELQILKYCVHNVAHAYNKTATFMPKPIVGDNGSGMHVHQSLSGRGATSSPATSTSGSPRRPSGTSEASSSTPRPERVHQLRHQQLQAAGARIRGAGAARLLGDEPLRLGAHPHSSPAGRRVEVRFPDSSGNPYFTFAALMMAGLDGIQNQIDPGPPLDKDLYDLPPEEEKGIPTVCASLDQALEALDADRDFLIAGEVFSHDLIDAYIELKMEEVTRFRMTTHPVEFDMYYSL